MSMEFEGFTEFQKDLLELAQVKLPKETFKLMRRVGNRAAVHVRRKAKADVIADTGNYHSRFKRGKVFRDAEGKIVTRVINSAHHAHLIEHGHRQVTKDGREVGYVLGFNVMSDGAKNFGNSGDFEKIVLEELDRMLDEAGL